MGETPMGSQRLWSRELDRSIRAGISQSVASKIAGSPPKTTKDKTKKIHAHFKDRDLIKLRNYNPEDKENIMNSILYFKKNLVFETRVTIRLF